MSPTDLEDRLSRSLAERAATLAPPDRSAARRAVALRSGALRRRRRIGRAASAAAALAAVAGLVAGGLAGRGDDDPDAVSSAVDAPASWHLDPPPAATPAFTVAGMVPTNGETAWYDPPPDAPPREPSDLVDPVTGVPLDQRPTVQVFRRPGDYAGPSVFVTHGPTIAPVEGDGVALAGGSGGRLDAGRPGVPRLSWQPSGSTALASAQAWGLTPEDLVAFVDGLALRPGGTGFAAAALPAGVAEDAVEPPADPSLLWSTYRVLDLTDPEDHQLPGQVHITVMRSDETDFELMLGRRLATAGSVEQITVLGHPAALIRDADGSRWSVQWRLNTADRVEVIVADPDRAAVDEVVAGLREIDEAGFDELLDEAGDDPRNANTPSTPMT
ncbi:MAG TPA: hypothetical protein VFI47_03955 [Acidimicrobiales bacterium]|nr:hypothetical protein [Acidimicrobiales bacterium]